tara:strand:- start:282 stop:446 length:165 start_codon:yes stop_codon:yes gene_type:complete
MMEPATLLLSNADSLCLWLDKYIQHKKWLVKIAIKLTRKAKNEIFYKKNGKNSG